MTTVKKGTGRPAALARQEKAAQRAPFPKAMEPQPAKPPRKLGTLAEEAAKAPDSISPKVAALTEVFSCNNWAFKVSKVGAAVKVVARRGKEVITIQWTAGVYDYGASSYRRADGTSVKLLNVSAAKKVAAQAVKS